MTPFFYKRAFKQSLSGDLMEMEGFEEDKTKFDDINILQMIWAMEYTHRMGQGMKDFEGWLAEFEYLDLSEVISDVFEEVMNATFHSKETPKKRKQNKEEE